MPKRRKYDVTFSNLSWHGKRKRLKQMEDSSSESLNDLSENNSPKNFITYTLHQSNSDNDSTDTVVDSRATYEDCLHEPLSDDIHFENDNSQDEMEIVVSDATIQSNVSIESDYQCSSETSLSDFESDNEMLTSTGTVKNFLRNWAADNNITLSAVSSLCSGLREVHPSCFRTLPKDGRTIMNTPKDVKSVQVPPGNYIHIGLKKQLDFIIGELFNLAIDIKVLHILVNIDGLSLYRSSPSEMIPILFSLPTIKQLENLVFPVGIYYGIKKPYDLSSFLCLFIEEMNDILTNGMSMNDRHIQVNFLGFCCDAPAKSYLMGVVGHNGFNSCTRCKVKGVSVGPKRRKRRIFLQINSQPRTNEEFLENSDPTYTRRSTPLTQIQNLNFVNDFILDYMHLICLGVMRKMLFTWCSGQPITARISVSQQTILSENLLSLRNAVPEEFARRPRELSNLKYWKATEFRTFLLYLGPVVLKDILNPDKYRHFLTLHIAVTILLNSNTCKHNDMLRYAQDLLKHFVTNTVNMYDQNLITHNFHGLIHVVDDVIHFSKKIPNVTLNTISAFPFENHMQKIKRMVRSKSKPLEQVGRRVGELFSKQVSITHILEEPQFKIHHSEGPLLALCKGPQFKKIKFNDFTLSISPPNNCCGLKNGSVVVIENIAYSTELDTKVVIGRKYLQRNNFFDEPLLNSKSLGIFKVERLSSRSFWPCSEIATKYISIPRKNYHVVFPLLHV